MMVIRHCERCGLRMEVEATRRTKRCIPCRAANHRVYMRHKMRRNRSRAYLIRDLDQAGYSYVIKVERGKLTHA